MKLNRKTFIVLITLLLVMLYIPALADDAHGTTTTTQTDSHSTGHDNSDGHHDSEITENDHHTDETKTSDHHAGGSDDHHAEGSNDHHANDSDNHYADNESNEGSHSDCETMMAKHHNQENYGEGTNADHHADGTKADDHYANDHHTEAKKPDCEAMMADHHSGEGLLTEYVADTKFALRSEIVDAETMAYVGLSEGIVDIRNPELAVDEGHIVEITLGNTTVDEHDLVIEFINSKIHSEHVVFEEDVTTFAFKAEDAGSYNYYCTVEGHREAGMEGVFVVKEHGH